MSKRSNDRSAAAHTVVLASFALIVVLATSASAPAQLFLYEGFDYDATKTDGASIAGGNGGTGWSGAWTTTGPLRYSSTGLTYSNGGALVTTGGAMIDNITGGGPNDWADRQMFSVDTDGTYWFSYLVAAPDGASNDVRNWSLFATTGGNQSTGFGSEMGRGADDEIEADIPGGTATSATTYTKDGTAALVVGQALLDSTGDDVVNLWVDIPLTVTEGTIGAPESSILLASPTFGDFFTYYNFPGQNELSTLDEIRLGGSLADVIPVVGGQNTVPEPASLAIWSLLGLALTGYGIVRRAKKK